MPKEFELPDTEIKKRLNIEHRNKENEFAIKKNTIPSFITSEFINILNE